MPCIDLHYALWDNLADPSWIARDLSQTAHSSVDLHILSQIGQLGITATITVLSIIVVFLTSLYEEDESHE